MWRMSQFSRYAPVHRLSSHCCKNVKLCFKFRVWYYNSRLKCIVCISFQNPHQDFKFRVDISSSVSSSVFNITNAVSNVAYGSVFKFRTRPPTIVALLQKRVIFYSIVKPLALSSDLPKSIFKFRFGFSSSV